jgi:DNA repair protein RecO (recombination protein O)
MRNQRLYRTDAIVLRRRDLGEADRVLTLYSPTIGKFGAIAKGVRRPKSRIGGHVELFTHVNVLVAQGRNLDIITQAATVRPFRAIRDDLWRAAYAAYAVELVDRFTEERLESAPVFELLRDVLEHIDSLPTAGQAGVVREAAAGSAAPVSMELCARNFEVRLLGYLGYAPELHHCIACGQRLAPEGNRFSPEEGGVLCGACSSLRPNVRPLSANAIKALRLMSREPFGIFRRLQLAADVSQEVELVLRSHINHHLEKQLRTSGFLDRMKADYRREARLDPVTA